MSSKRIEASLAEHRETFDILAGMAGDIARCADLLTTTLQRGNRVLICGNGGSAADAQHFAAELTNRFEKDHNGYPVIALTTDTSALTAIGNDLGFEQVFSRQLQALGQVGDLLIAISTSGNSPNVMRAVETAREREIGTIGLLGRDGGALATLVDQPLVVPSRRTARVQEAHIFILHVLCECFDASL